jgi:hypothetical protein
MTGLRLSDLPRRGHWERLVTSTVGVWGLRALVAVIAIAVGSVLPASSRAVAVLAIAVAGVLTVQLFHRRVAAGRKARLGRFAAANRLTYVPSDQWTEPSALIERAANCRTSDEFRRSDAVGSLRIGTLTFEVERASTFVTEHWGYIAQFVPGAPLPHIMLVSRDARGRSLPAALDPALKMTLEGDFSTYFDLYCTADARLDALYVLTPDLMASLLDNAEFSSMELTGNWVFFFTPGRFDPEDAAQWRRSLELVSTVGADSLKRVRRLNRVESARPVGDPTSTPMSSAKRTRLTLSIGRSNWSTDFVGIACLLVIIGVFLWAWLR